MEQLASFLKRFQTEPAADAYRYLGCHRLEDGSGYVFRVWAPHAAAVHVVGDFNFWNAEDLPMRKLDGGVWEAVSAYAKEGQAYKYCVQGRSGRTVYKTDPYGNRCCALPETSSIIDPPDGFCWHDSAYRARMAKQSAIRRPVNIYEVHAGSWKRHDDGSYLSYEELAAELDPLCQGHGLYPYRAPAASWNTPTTRRGAIRSPATSLRPTATGRRSSSCSSSTLAIRRASA